jgi:ribosomal protein S18 acetylase RimI-like enzyme
VEPARRRDALALLALHRTVLEEGRWFITQIDEFDATFEDKEEHLARLNAALNAIYLVARTPEERVAGFLTLTGGPLRRMQHVARLEIMVHPRQRGRGIGRALMSAGLEWAATNPVITKVSLSVFDHNTRAIALYRDFGFQEEGRRPREYRTVEGTYEGDVLLYRLVD